MPLLGAAAAGMAILLGWQEMRNVPRVVFVVALAMLIFALGYDPALIVTAAGNMARLAGLMLADRKSTRLNSSHVRIAYAVFCLKKKSLLASACLTVWEELPGLSLRPPLAAI